MPEACIPLGPINTISQNRRMKNQDPNENNAQKMNIPTLLESQVLDELIVPACPDRDTSPRSDGSP